MIKRTKLSERALPNYYKGEEIMNMVTHIVGGGLGIAALVLCVLKAAFADSILAIVCAVIYGISMISLYTMSSIYHGLHPGTGKKVMQIIDHCTIYFLIAGTYTPITLCAIAPQSPALGWGLFAVEWILALAASALTAIDLKKFNIISMVCYIGMGWAIIFFLPQAWLALGPSGFGLIFSGGICYTVGAILYGIGSKIHWMHSVFHIFVVLGSAFHFLGIFLYVL